MCCYLHFKQNHCETWRDHNLGWDTGPGFRIPAFGDFPFVSWPPTIQVLCTRLTMSMNKSQFKTKLRTCLHAVLAQYKTHEKKPLPMGTLQHGQA
jgi:hypothetical protein